MMHSQSHLILVAHGSRLEQTRDELFSVADQVQPLIPASCQIHVAFLELSAPLLVDMLAEICKEKPDTVYILPYLLASGRHLLADIPLCIEKTMVQYRNIKIVLLPHLGLNPTLPSLVANHFTEFSRNE